MDAWTDVRMDGGTEGGMDGRAERRDGTDEQTNGGAHWRKAGHVVKVMVKLLKDSMKAFDLMRKPACKTRCRCRWEIDFPPQVLPG